MGVGYRRTGFRGLVLENQTYRIPAAMSASPAPLLRLKV